MSFTGFISRQEWRDFKGDACKRLIPKPNLKAKTPQENKMLELFDHPFCDVVGLNNLVRIPLVNSEAIPRYLNYLEMAIESQRKKAFEFMQSKPVVYFIEGKKLPSIAMLCQLMEGDKIISTFVEVIHKNPNTTFQNDQSIITSDGVESPSYICSSSELFREDVEAVRDLLEGKIVISHKMRSQDNKNCYRLKVCEPKPTIAETLESKVDELICEQPDVSKEQMQKMKDAAFALLSTLKSLELKVKLIKDLTNIATKQFEDQLSKISDPLLVKNLREAVDRLESKYLKRECSGAEVEEDLKLIKKHLKYDLPSKKEQNELIKSLYLFSDLKKAKGEGIYKNFRNQSTIEKHLNSLDDQMQKSNQVIYKYCALCGLRVKSTQSSSIQEARASVAKFGITLDSLE